MIKMMDQIWDWIIELFPSTNLFINVGVFIGGLTAVVSLILNLRKLLNRSIDDESVVLPSSTKNQKIRNIKNKSGTQTVNLGDQTTHNIKEQTIVSGNQIVYNNPSPIMTIHPEQPTQSYNVALQYEEQLDYPRALAYYKKALDGQISKSGPSHIDVARVHNALGNLLHEMAQYQDALEHYNHGLAICKNNDCGYKTDVAIIYNNIAIVYKDQGEYVKALELHQKALAIREKVLGKEHPDIADTYSNIAVVYDCQGEYPNALEFYQKDLAICEKTLGKEHPSTATTYNNIAIVYKEQGKYVKALEWYQKALVIFKTKLGAEHPCTVTVRGNMDTIKDKAVALTIR